MHLSITILALLLSLTPAAAQTSADSAGRDTVRVFLDCPSCDESYIRTEITFVNYVRDPASADVHVLITTERTGSGGVQYSLKFIGLGRFQGVDSSLTYTAPEGATLDEIRRGLTSILKLGLVRYVAESPLASRLSLEFKGEPAAARTQAARDPWNYWVFRVGGNGGIEGEQATSERSVAMNFSANRTTEEWKVTVSGFGSYRSQRFELEEDETFTAVRRSYDSRALLARSLTQHWSVGAAGAIAASTFTNYDLRTRIGPGIEYNVFPYSESTRRILTVFYTVGLQTANYTEETIFGRLSERLFDQQVDLSLGLRQPWGTARAGLELSHYLNRTGKWRVDAFGGLDVRLFKGFSVFMDGNVARRRDQLSLRRGEATTEEILIRQRELATDYAYEFDFGISYSFGSIFNNVVNPRFRNASGF